MWSEFDESKKVKHIIEVAETDIDENIVYVRKLVFREIWYPLYPREENYVERRWEIHYDIFDNSITIITSQLRNEWNGTGCDFSFVINVPKVPSNEIPWFLDEQEIEIDVETFGVKKIIEDTFQSLIDMIREHLKLALGGDSSD